MLLVLACSIHRSSVFSRSRAVGVRSGSITYTAGQKDHAPRQNPSYQTPHVILRLRTMIISYREAQDQYQWTRVPFYSNISGAAFIVSPFLRVL